VAESPHGPHRTASFWVDLAVALAALCVSAASLWVALRTDRTQERLLAASVWPVLQFVTSDYVETNDPTRTRNVVRFTVTNAGVGPATLQWFDAYYRGRPIADTISFLRQCCDRSNSQFLARTKVSNYMQGRVLAARETIHFIEVPRNPSNATAYAILVNERLNVYIRTCYCSVLDECWLFDSRRIKPVSVGKECPPGERPLFQG